LAQALAPAEARAIRRGSASGFAQGLRAVNRGVTSLFPKPKGRR
jgi:hypothetical protein